MFIEKTVPPDHGHRRLDHFLTETDLQFTRSKIQRMIRNGDVKVNRVTITKSGHHISPGDIISMHIQESERITAIPEAIDLDIVYEDDALLVVNKPPGMVVHPAVGNWRSTLVNALLHHCRDLSDVGEPFRPGIVHRLDKGTSGLLVAAKRDEVHVALSKQLSERKISRRYMALVWGQMKNKSGTIETDIGRHPKHRQRMAVLETGSGRRSVTHYVVDRIFTDITLLSIKLETGRTHQIRVHMAHTGYPVVGDPVYGGRTKWLSRLSPAGKKTAQKILDMLDRQALHAASLGFTHPLTNEWLDFQAPPPSDMAAAMRILDQI